MIRKACGKVVRRTECHNFETARAHLSRPVRDALLTNLRLRDYNGLHLVLLAKASNGARGASSIRSNPDPFLIREAQGIGAFFERTDRLPLALAGYLLADLPDRDRRDPERFDRRVAFRGGRRAVDQPVHA